MVNKTGRKKGVNTEVSRRGIKKEEGGQGNGERNKGVPRLDRSTTLKRGGCG